MALSDGRARSALEIDSAAFGVPRVGERLSGDSAVIERRDGILFIAIVDVLGHGAAASVVASGAASFLRESWRPDVADTMVRLHEELRGTRGAVAGMCAIDATGGSRFSGIGDTGVVALGSAHPGLHSREGILGSHIRTPQEQRFRLQRGDILVLHTDGVSSDFPTNLPTSSGSIRADHLARRIVQSFRRPHDDATCVVAVAGGAP